MGDSGAEAGDNSSSSGSGVALSNVPLHTLPLRGTLLAVLGPRVDT